MGFVGSLDPQTEDVARDIVDAAYVVHRTFGPGLLEDIYKECLAFELAKRGRRVIREARCRIYYDGVELATPLRLDLLVDDLVIIEVKAVEKLIPLFTAQCVRYLKLSGKRLCLLINFNVERIGDGIKRIIRWPLRGP